MLVGRDAILFGSHCSSDQNKNRDSVVAAVKSVRGNAVSTEQKSLRQCREVMGGGKACVHRLYVANM